MNTNKLFAWIALILFVMGSVLVFVVAKGARIAQNKVYSDVGERSLYDNVVNDALFSIGKGAFETLNGSCPASFRESVYLNIYFEYGLTPSSCALFINDKLSLTIQDLEPDCRIQCPATSFARTIALQGLDVREPQRIKVCCDGTCLEDEVISTCDFFNMSEQNST